MSETWQSRKAGVIKRILVAGGHRAFAAGVLHISGPAAANGM
jgi:hypothetical protein